MKSKVFLGLFLTVVIFCAWRVTPQVLAWWHGRQTIAQVGDYVISAQDVAWKNAVTRVYYPQENRDVGLQLLTAAFTTAQILKNNGQEITNEILNKENTRIDKQSLRPEMLATIKSIFEGDEKGYLRIFVLPVYAERTIYYDFFQHSEVIQAASKNVAEQFLRRVIASPSQFHNLAHRASLQPRPLTVSAKFGLEWESPEKKLGRSVPKIVDASGTPADIQQKFNSNVPTSAMSEEGQRWIKDVVSTTSPRHVFEKVIDHGEQWMVAFYLGKHKSQKGAHVFDIIMFAKADFGKWSAEQTRLVKVITNK